MITGVWHDEYDGYDANDGIVSEDHDDDFGNYG